MEMEINFKPIGIIRSCYTDKFGIPRQPGLVKSATAKLELLPPYNQPEAFRGLEDFSHLWITFVFHQSISNGWKSTVRPPRLGGNERIGVFASRSNFRPNPIGLSVVELKKVDGISLTLGGGDFLDRTPVLDIKPYIPYSDSLPDAHGAFAAEPPMPGNSVTFLPEVEQKFQSLETGERPNLKQLISDMLSYNPRPAYQNDDPERIFGTTVFDLEVKWKESGHRVTVFDVRPI
ncbi:tRNA (N6-threonylcarbamoyladenosine(37)-N6)-methyltransferase TrmO [Pontiellaceae bacterium B1224]|nr:tRNA (N6-threonylcarbamoyladenosine(37)-N6)-methyltransferase TrmO [Pontiellaceae bacterium B1224]